MTELALNSAGRRLDANLVAPEGAASGAGLLFVHGLGSSQRGYLERAGAATNELGCTCLTFDLSGHGASEGDLSEVLVGDHLADRRHRSRRLRHVARRRRHVARARRRHERRRQAATDDVASRRRATVATGRTTVRGIDLVRGRDRIGGRQRRQAGLAGPVDDALHERLAARHLILAEADAEQLLDERVVAAVSTRRRRTASAIRRALPPTMRTETASTIQSV